MIFGKTFSIAEIKVQHNVEQLDIVRNPNTQKLFVSAGGKTIAAVSKNYDPTKPRKEFVELISEDTGEVTLCLHNGNDANVVETL